MKVTRHPPTGWNPSGSQFCSGRGGGRKKEAHRRGEGWRRGKEKGAVIGVKEEARRRCTRNAALEIAKATSQGIFILYVMRRGSGRYRTTSRTEARYIAAKMFRGASGEPSGASCFGYTPSPSIPRYSERDDFETLE